MAGRVTVPYKVVRRVCAVAGSPTLIVDARLSLDDFGVSEAVGSRGDRMIFDWLMETISYQGIADAVAEAYMDLHGRVAAADIDESLALPPPCRKLHSYWEFEGCRYHKGSTTCAEPEHIDRCPLPRHDLRNGRLNQTAYSLFLFFRDVIGGDFVGWVDQRLAEASAYRQGRDRARHLRQALLVPLGQVHGVSSKVLSMALSNLLIAGDPDRPLWVETGAAMIAVDTLVHNFLHRTGVLRSFGADHLYGVRCYAENGCADIIERLAAEIDARTFNPDFPAFFPRFVQHAIWRFCAQSGLDECNGNRIDDRFSCDRWDCSLSQSCVRQPLKAQINL